VHLQFLGFPIANDPVYNDKTAWGESRGRGGVFINYNFRDPEFPEAAACSEETPQPVPSSDTIDVTAAAASTLSPRPLPSPDPTDVTASPVTLSTPEAETSSSADPSTPDPSASSSGKPARRKRGPRPKSQPRPAARQHHVYVDADGNELAPGSDVPLSDDAARAIIRLRTVRDHDDQFSRERDAGPGARRADGLDQGMIGRDDEGEYCKKCGVPLLPDPRPEQLFIWLHAMRYTTDKWDFASELPSWARDDWEPNEGDKMALEQY
jgi:hypothetical protein